jgi:hypothetical protein
VRREALYNILIEFGVPMKLVVLCYFCCFLAKEGKGKQHRKNTNGNMQSVTTWKTNAKKKKQGSRILQTYENIISYTPKDGHVGRNMW